MCTVHSFLRIKVKLIQYIEDTIGSKRDTYTGNTSHTEYTGQIVIATATCDTSDLHIQGFHFKDSASIVVQSAGKRQIQFQFIFQTENRQSFQDKLAFFHTLLTDLTTRKHFFQSSQFFFIRTIQQNNRLQFGNSFITDTFFLQFCIHIVQTYFIQFINGYCDIHYFISLTNNLSDTSQNLTVINLNTNPDTQTGKDRINNLHQLYFIQ